MFKAGASTRAMKRNADIFKVVFFASPTIMSRLLLIGVIRTLEAYNGRLFMVAAIGMF